jgi:uncharacterized protein YjdB
MRERLAVAALAAVLALCAAPPAIAETDTQPAIETDVQTQADEPAAFAEEEADDETVDEGMPAAVSEDDDVEEAAPAAVAEEAAPVTYAKPALSFSGHVQNIGWMKAVTVTPGTSATIGTTGRALRLEAFTCTLTYPSAGAQETIPDGAIEAQYRTGSSVWSGWVAAGSVAGTQGKAMRLEGVALRLTGTLANQYDLYYRVHMSGTGWTAWTSNGAKAGCIGQDRRLEAIEIKLVAKDAAASARPATGNALTQSTYVSYRSHVQNIGWMSRVSDGAVSGTSGRALRMEAFDAKLVGYDVSGGIRYAAHVQNVGWQGWSSDGAATGTTGRSLRMEAIKMELTGAMADSYDVYYRVHVQNYGWLDWAKNGAVAGTYGLALRVEAVQVKIVAKGTDPGLPTARPCVATPDVLVSTTGRGQAASAWTTGVSGTTGKSLPLTSFSAKLGTTYGISGGVTYRTAGNGNAWSAWASNGAASGSAPIHAVEMKLTGDLAGKFDIWYRVHLSSSGWLGWAKNGQSAGTLDTDRTVEAVEVRIVSKNSSAPGANCHFMYLTDATMSSRIMAAVTKTPTTPEGWCARWITNVYSNAGLGEIEGDARDFYWNYCKSADRSKLVAGMVVAVPTHALTSAGRTYGHVAIYIGNGKVMDSVGYVRTMSLDTWISRYGTLAQVRWGFA